jgi:hypothetical protein
VAGQVSGGQQLTPNRNVTARAGVGGDVWGANGGGMMPVGGGSGGQTGYDKPVAITAADGETATNYLVTDTRSVLGQENIGALTGQTADSSLPASNSNAG